MNNTHNVAKKISEEIGCNMILARRMEEQLTKIHESLRPVVSAWLKNERVGFEFKGITLDMIMEKERAKYIQAIFSMNALLNDPQVAELYGDFQFDTDFLED